MRWAGHIACMVEKSNAYTVLAGNPEGKRSLVRSRCRWEPNFKMDIEVGKRMGLCIMDFSGSGYSQVVNCCECRIECLCSVNSADY